VKAILALVGALAAGMCGLGALAVLLGASAARGACSTESAQGSAAPSETWTATAYGPPWGGIEGDGVTAAGADLRAGPPALEVAVDPRLIPLGSYVHVWPSPFGTRRAFYAGDTGGAIVGRHIDIYDWRGRAAQDAWGTRTVTITPAPTPSAGSAIDGEEDAPPLAGDCTAAYNDGPPQLTPGQTAHIEPDGTATVPREAPSAVQRAIAAGNLIHTLPYPEPDVHYGTLARLWPAYDCSGATSLVLYATGLLGPNALDSTGLETYGQPGPGHWITVYANSTHAWIVVAGIALDTADYGGPSIPAGTGPRWRSEPLANLKDGTTYVVRHPAGL
jgi:3D (Asp-Asp-Asp) domain-containing protein